MGRPWRRAYSTSSDLVMPHILAGAMIFRSGASALTVTSNLTWSLPLDVEPCATASAPTRRATSTTFSAISGLAKAVPRG